MAFVARTLRAVAIQPTLRIGDVDGNLRRCADLVTQAAREHSPDVIMLPEAASSPNAFDRRMRDVARPVDGEPLQLLRRLAREHGCIVGGGFIAIRGAETRGTYALCEPDGAFHLHDKDLPSFWENSYYRPGKDDGVAPTAAGVMGLANGWEWGRTQTCERLMGRVQLLGGGMHFPSYPDWALTRKWFIERDQELFTQYGRELPGRVARFLGVPAIHPSHVGEFEMETPMVPGLKWRSHTIGQTQITDADGQRLAYLDYGDGEGYVCADIELEEQPRPRDPLPRTFWNSEFPLSAHVVWLAGNAHGRASYAIKSRLGRHRWTPGTDLPDHVPAEAATEVLAGR
ncbi:carbon-nitrogen hydrolase family protein [Paraconexibacter algicola]|uniref:carbon-nitrogen hydrolase family protein n=1 Tax=Paraconexibacter algicola TaxID=2133960 RepID=UPI001E36C90B|nr:carbon-nitrogen hydrolase family protein [Paraconexibacter algicola]